MSNKTKFIFILLFFLMAGILTANYLLNLSNNNIIDETADTINNKSKNITYLNSIDNAEYYTSNKKHHKIHIKAKKAVQKDDILFLKDIFGMIDLKNNQEISFSGKKGEMNLKNKILSIEEEIILIVNTINKISAKQLLVDCKNFKILTDQPIKLTSKLNNLSIGMRARNFRFIESEAKARFSNVIATID